LAKKYAVDNPEAAGALRIRSDRIDDPSVQLLVDGFAFLNARTARKLDDGHSDVLSGYLDVLYPHFLRPLPSMMVTQFYLSPTRAGQGEGQLIPAGCRLETEPVDGEPCSFRTCWPIHLLPVKLGETRFIGPPFPAGGGRAATQAVSALRTRLSCLSDQLKLAGITWQRMGLRFFIHESRDDTFHLAEFLFRHLAGVAIVHPETGALLAELGPEAVEPIGFEADEGILDYGPRTFPGYGLLTDLFVYPQRFSFFALRAEAALAKIAAPSADLIFFFNRRSEQLEATVQKAPLRIGCAPIINLYDPGTVAFALDRTIAEQPIVIDWDRTWKHEVFSVDHVELFDPLSERAIQFRPIYAQAADNPTADADNLYWVRREYVGKSSSAEVSGSDVFLSTVDLADDEPVSENAVFRVEVTALNRDLPLRLPAGEGHPRISLKDLITGVTVQAVTSPTRTVRPSTAAGEPWRIASHLTLNHVSILDVEALKELLYLYQLICHDDPREDLAHRMIQSLAKLTVAPSTERVVIGGRPAFVRGQHVTIQIDAVRLPPGRAYLLASVLTRFFSRYGSINSFVRTTAVIDGKEVSPACSQIGSRHVL
jgi:type VI secretion system protein ImpG